MDESRTASALHRHAGWLFDCIWPFTHTSAFYCLYFLFLQQYKMFTYNIFFKWSTDLSGILIRGRSCTPWLVQVQILDHFLWRCATDKKKAKQKKKPLNQSKQEQPGMENSSSSTTNYNCFQIRPTDWPAAGGAEQRHGTATYWGDAESLIKLMHVWRARGSFCRSGSTTEGILFFFLLNNDNEHVIPAGGPIKERPLRLSGRTSDLRLSQPFTLTGRKLLSDFRV